MIARRALLAVPVAAAARAQDAWAALARDCTAAIAARLPAGDAPLLLLSWDVAGAEPEFARVNGNAAFTYDNALAGLALLAQGESAAAARIGRALALNQANDRHWRDGRLRNAYLAGPATARLPGWWDGRWVEDAYHVGSAAGVVAWAALLWLGLAEATRDRAWLEPARRAADWIEATQRRPLGFGGGFFGHEPNPRAEGWVSTEHNADLEAVFGRLGRASAAAHAAAFVDAMWDGAAGRFLTGLRPDGSRNDHAALDANVWPLLARPALLRGERRRALDWVRARHGTPAGFDFDDDRDGAWTEGTAFTALALRLAGVPEADRYAALLASRRTATGFLAAADVPSLSTGLSTGIDPNTPDFRYPRLPHLGATAWAALAGAGVNPFAPFR